jgi:hypothetical protein
VVPTRVGEDGRFTITGYQPGRYFFTSAGRAPGWFLKSVMVNGINALDQPFELTTEDLDTVVVTFVDRQTTLSGTVTGASGAPAEGTVMIFPAAHREWIARGMAGRLVRSVRTQAAGSFTIAGLPARDYLVVALAEEDVPDPQDPSVYAALARVATTVTLVEDGARTVSLKLAQVVR